MALFCANAGSRQPAVRTVTRVCGVLRLTLIIGPRMYFGAILCKKARQLRVYKAFGGRRHTEGRCSSIDENGKSRHSVWLSDDVWQEVDAFYKLDNCPIRNEFAEKALRQYCGRLHAERTGAYLPRALQGVLEGTLGVFGERLGRLLLKLAVEHNMTNHLWRRHGYDTRRVQQDARQQRPRGVGDPWNDLLQGCAAVLQRRLTDAKPASQ